MNFFFLLSIHQELSKVMQLYWV